MVLSHYDVASCGQLHGLYFEVSKHSSLDKVFNVSVYSASLFLRRDTVNATVYFITLFSTVIDNEFHFQLFFLFFFFINCHLIKSSGGVCTYFYDMKNCIKIPEVEKNVYTFTLV